jgi:hypothetical protein
MLPSGLVRSLWVKFTPGPLVNDCTTFPATKRSVVLVVVALSELHMIPAPNEPEVTSSGLVVAIPLYSKILTSGYSAAGENDTVTVSEPLAILKA